MPGSKDALTLLSPATMPPPASRYSHVVTVPEGMELAFVSGQVAMRPDGTVPDGIEAQCEQVMANLSAALAAAGMGPRDTVRLNAYLVDAGDVGIWRAVRDRWTDGHEPASTVVVVAALSSPGWLVEVEAVAARRRDG